MAIFNPIDPEADKIDIEIRGLVNDIITEKLDNGHWKIQERVLKITFHRPGDEFYTSLDKFTFVGKEWVIVPSEIKAPDTHSPQG